MTTTGDLRAAGVSIWLDDLSRERIRSGGLGRLIAERDVVGITTNPTIFANAISAEAAYRTQLDEIRRSDASPTDSVFSLITADVQAACDVLSPVFEATGGGGAVQLLTDGREIYARTADGAFFNLLRTPAQALMVVGDEELLKVLSGKVRPKKAKARNRRPKIS